MYTPFLQAWPAADTHPYHPSCMPSHLFIWPHFPRLISWLKSSITYRLRFSTVSVQYAIFVQKVYEVI